VQKAEQQQQQAQTRSCQGKGNTKGNVRWQKPPWPSCGESSIDAVLLDPAKQMETHAGGRETVNFSIRYMLLSSSSSASPHMHTSFVKSKAKQKLKARATSEARRSWKETTGGTNGDKTRTEVPAGEAYVSSSLETESNLIHPSTVQQRVPFALIIDSLT